MKIIFQKDAEKIAQIIHDSLRTMLSKHGVKLKVKDLEKFKLKILKALS